MGAQARDGVVDVVDGEHDTMQAQLVGRRLLPLGAQRRGSGSPAVAQPLAWPIEHGWMARASALVSGSLALARPSRWP